MRKAEHGDWETLPMHTAHFTMMNPRYIVFGGSLDKIEVDREKQPHNSLHVQPIKSIRSTKPCKK